MADMSSGVGLATGIDYANMITQLMYLERAPERVLQKKKSTLQSQMDTLNRVKDQLSTLQSTASAFSSADKFLSKTATSTDDKTVKVSASSTALTGSHVIKVSKLAQSQIQKSAGYASSTDTTTFAAGSFTITSDKAGATPVTVTTTSTTSLEGMASAINGAKAGVTASIINDGSGTPYRLVITGSDAATYTFAGDPLALTESQAAQKAQFTVDGIAVTKESNLVTDVISGVTLTLLQAPPATAAPGTTLDVTVSVNNDTDAMKKKINDFVSGYNSAMWQINSQSMYNSTTKSAPALSGDSTLRMVKSQLQSVLTNRVSGVDGSFSILSSIGIATQKDGSLKVDDTKLSDALSKNFNDVVDLFTKNAGTTGLSSDQYGVAEQFRQALETLTKSYLGPSSDANGLISTRINGISSTMKDIDDRIASMEVRMVAKEANLKKQFVNLEKMVSSLQTQGNSMISALSRSYYY